MSFSFNGDAAVVLCSLTCGATENFYFPMATFNWMLGVNLRF